MMGVKVAITKTTATTITTTTEFFHFFVAESSKVALLEFLLDSSVEQKKNADDADADADADGHSGG